MNIASAAENADKAVDGLMRRATVTIGTIAHLPKSMFDWRNPEPLLVTLAGSLKHAPEFYSIFVGLPDGATIQAMNLIGSGGRRHEIAGMPSGAMTAWRVAGPVEDGADRPQSWWFFDAEGKEVPGVAGIDISYTDYDPRTRPWYLNAQAVRRTIVSEVYLFFSLMLPGVTVAQPLDNLPAGTVGIDLSLRDLAVLTQRLSPGSGGVVAVIDDKGGVVAYPDPQQAIRFSQHGSGIELIPVDELHDDRVRMAYQEIDRSGPSHRSFAIRDADFISYFRPAHVDSVAKWHVVSIAAVADFTGALSDKLRRSLLISIAVLVIAVLGVAATAGWVSQPVVRLRSMADQITQLNFKNIEPFQSPFEEVNRLQVSMDKMRGALETFLRFVPRDVVRELVQAGQAARIGGSKREVTILFSDVDGFTAMTERMTPEEIMSQASEYFENLSIGIQANRGTIDKFIGDAIMALWNAPSNDPNHAENACRGALAAFHISEKLNNEFLVRGKSVMRTRFGLHTGEALVGNIGAHDRMQYTCLGSSVNLAARIEGLNKFYGTQVLVSEAVRKRASNVFLFRRVDVVEAKGTTQPVTIYELMGERGECAAFYVGATTLRRASKYEQAFDFYLHREFSDALGILEQLASETPDDPVVALLARKCRNYASTPPPRHWNGATALDSK